MRTFSTSFEPLELSPLAFQGQVYICLAQPEIAHAVLDEAIGALDPDAAKQRACYLADQATVCVDQGEVDQACQLGIQALQLLGAVEYETESATSAPSCGPGQIIRPWPT